MTMYDIAIDYTTGDSFSNEHIQAESVGILTSDLNKAKDNLSRIKHHYMKHVEDPNFGKRQKLMLLTDDGEREIYPFWIGYFETLHGAKIVIEEDNEIAFDL